MHSSVVPIPIFKPDLQLSLSYVCDPLSSYTLFLSGDHRSQNFQSLMFCYTQLERSELPALVKDFWHIPIVQRYHLHT